MVSLRATASSFGEVGPWGLLGVLQVKLNNLWIFFEPQCGHLVGSFSQSKIITSNGWPHPSH